MSDEDHTAQLAAAFRTWGATDEQARVMAVQLLKRARQIAQDKKITEDVALAELLAKVAAGRRGDYTGP